MSEMLLYIDKNVKVTLTEDVSALFHTSSLLPGVSLQRMMGYIAQSKPLALHNFHKALWDALSTLNTVY